MQSYDKEKPLISLHIPKCGGQTFLQVLSNWFGQENFYLHYFDEERNTLPAKHPLRKGICIHGHFDRAVKTAAQDYYPEVDQFITILRDPFDVAVSNYFYRKSIGTAWGSKDNRRFQDVYPDIRSYMHAYITDTNFYLANLSFDLTMENYEEIFEKYFIYIGIVEDMQTTVDILADKLGFQSFKIGNINRSKHDEEIPSELIEKFISSRPLEYAIYQYALKRHIKQHSEFLTNLATSSEQKQTSNRVDANLTYQLNLMQNSFSWKITRPIRSVKKFSLK